MNFDLDGSSFAVRENLVDILERELLGPIHGPEEVLPFSPRSQYLVGHIAPVKLDGRAGADDADEATRPSAAIWSRSGPTTTGRRGARGAGVRG